MCAFNDCALFKVCAERFFVYLVLCNFVFCRYEIFIFKNQRTLAARLCYCHCAYRCCYFLNAQIAQIVKIIILNTFNIVFCSFFEFAEAFYFGVVTFGAAFQPLQIQPVQLFQFQRKYFVPFA